MLYGVDYISHLMGVAITTYLCPMLILTNSFILNLLAKLVFRIVLLATLHYCVWQLRDLIRHLYLLDG